MKQSFNDQHDLNCNTRIEAESVKKILKRQDWVWAFDGIVELALQCITTRKIH